MGLFSAEIHSMDDLFLHGLQDLYYAENQIVKALPEMVEKASDKQLAQSFKAHLEETKGQIKRLEQVFKMLGKAPQGVDCPAIDGLIDEAQDIAGDIDDKQVLDAALISAAQAVEHYEIARYGTLCAWAKQLGMMDAAKLLEETLEQEKKADATLNKIALKDVNRKAA
jgi:ferritin-like metal-binding protein YciE